MKKLSKKLKLNKETISALNNEQMKNVKGGGATIYDICLEGDTNLRNGNCIIEASEGGVCLPSQRC